MPVKDDVVGLFVKRFVIPGAQYFDKPGFVDFKISGITDIYARQIFYPEDFFVKFEKDLVDKYGAEAKRALYSIGKKFGYRFAQSGKFENITNHPGEKIKDWVLIASKFVEGTYASAIENETDPKLKRTDYHLKNFVILRKLGFDPIFAVGGSAGLMAWIYQDPSIEGVLHDVKKTDLGYEATVTNAPSSYLKEQFKDVDIYEETNLSDLLEDFKSYKEFNKQVKTSSTKSFQTYLDAGFISYKQGIVNIKDHRFFLFEVSGTYMLERELRKINPEYLDLLYESAFYSGEKIMSEFSTNLQDVFDMLSALGWGEVLVFSSNEKQIQILLNHFPWCRWYTDVEFIIMKGFLSGILSAKKGKKIEFKKPAIDLNKGYLSLLFKADL